MLDADHDVLQTERPALASTVPVFDLNGEVVCEQVVEALSLYGVEIVEAARLVEPGRRVGLFGGSMLNIVQLFDASVVRIQGD